MTDEFNEELEFVDEESEEFLKKELKMIK